MARASFGRDSAAHRDAGSDRSSDLNKTVSRES